MWTKMNDFDQLFGNMNMLRSRMNHLFADYDRSYGDQNWQVVGATPPTNMYDNGDQFEIKAQVPGVAKDDLSIKIQGNYLELSGSRKPDAPKGYRAHRVERPESTFTRSFTLPADVDVAKVAAKLHEGILSLTLPKAEAAKPKQITIK